MATGNVPRSRTLFEVRFQSLHRVGFALSFPCDAQGHVNLDALSEHGKSNYLYARATIGREFAAPTVCQLP